MAENFMMFGTTYPTSAKYCHPLPGVGLDYTATAATTAAASSYSGVHEFAKMAYGNIGTYLWENYANEKGDGLTIFDGLI